MSNECWKSIKNYEGLYDVSNFGNVRSVKRAGTKGGVLTPALSSSKYLCVVLSKNNNPKTVNIHTLVWDHFGNKNRNSRAECVDHIDNNKLNNCIKNLQILSQRDNLSKYYSKIGKLNGATFFKGKWQSSISVSGMKIHLGVYSTQQEAHETYKRYKLENLL